MCRTCRACRHTDVQTYRRAEQDCHNVTTCHTKKRASLAVPVLHSAPHRMCGSADRGILSASSSQHGIFQLTAQQVCRTICLSYCLPYAPLDTGPSSTRASAAYSMRAGQHAGNAVYISHNRHVTAYSGHSTQQTYPPGTRYRTGYALPHATHAPHGRTLHPAFHSPGATARPSPADSGDVSRETSLRLPAFLQERATLPVPFHPPRALLPTSHSSTGVATDTTRTPERTPQATYQPISPATATTARSNKPITNKPIASKPDASRLHSGSMQHSAMRPQHKAPRKTIPNNSCGTTRQRHQYPSATV